MYVRLRDIAKSKMSDAKEELKEEFDAKKAYLLHKGRSLYYTTRPVQLAPDELPEDFEELGQRDILLIAKHKTKELYRVTPIQKDGSHGATEYFAVWGVESKSKRAKQWYKAREAEYLKGLQKYDKCIAYATGQARATGADVDAAAKAADELFQKQNPVFCVEF